MKKHGKGMTARFLRAQHEKDVQVHKAMTAASETIDKQSQELIALRRILTSERAQVIYYTDKYCAMVNRTCLDVAPVPFLELPEDQQTEYTKRAILELYGDNEIAPHGSKGALKLVV